MKMSGSYYTPEPLARFAAQYVRKICNKAGRLKVLEPSCGDGAFLSAIYVELNNGAGLEVDAIEINQIALDSARDIKTPLGINVTYHLADFLDLRAELTSNYDVIIGNPPYISYSHLTEQQMQLCRELHDINNLSSNRIRNIWTSFLVGSVNLLSEDGVLAFVLPSEFLQVQYATELQNLLKDNFSRIDIFTFTKIIFEGIEQDTILVVATRCSDEKGLFFASINSLSQLDTDNYFIEQHNNERFKWNCHILNKLELQLVEEISDMFPSLGNMSNMAAGIVTGADKFFVLSSDTVAKYNLEKFVVPIIKSAAHVGSSVEIDIALLEDNKSAGLRSCLLDLRNYTDCRDNHAVSEYIAMMYNADISTRHKCSRRVPWYVVPNVWSSELVFFKRAHKYPKLLLNTANTLVTDSAYRISLHEEYDGKSVVRSFYNSLTLLLAELEGRSYGGGVLEVTPNECRKLRIPYHKMSTRHFEQFKNSFKSSTDLDQVIIENDRLLLQQIGRLSESTVTQLQRIREKLMARRLGKMNPVSDINRSSLLCSEFVNLCGSNPPPLGATQISTKVTDTPLLAAG